jgi:PAS domain-containing protein
VTHQTLAALNQLQVEHVALILKSFRHWTGKEILNDKPSDHLILAQAIWTAPFALVSHGTEDDPIFNYANQAALEIFGYSWEEWIRLPSRLSAEAPNREARQKLLDDVREKGFSDGYSGIRIGKQGRFIIENAMVWNLIDEEGRHRGQAACFQPGLRIPAEDAPGN